MRAADDTAVIPYFYAAAQTYRGQQRQTVGRMAINLTSLSNEELKKFISSFDTVLTDCDGMYVIVCIGNQK